MGKRANVNAGGRYTLHMLTYTAETLARIQQTDTPSAKRGCWVGDWKEGSSA